MKLHKLDFLVIGFFFGMAFIDFLNKEYAILAAHGFTLGVYLSVCYFLNNNDVSKQKGVKE